MVLCFCFKTHTRLSSSRTQILLHVRSLDLGVPDLEPYFCTLAFYDLKQGIKLSEDFHFDVNPIELLSPQMLEMRKSADLVTLCKHVIFSLKNPNHDVVLILRVERVLQGDPDDTTEPYLRERRVLTIVTFLFKVNK